jgi:quinol monooxygenase YgiN
VYEQYKDEAALETHRSSGHFKEYATNGFLRFVEERHAELFDPISRQSAYDESRAHE